MHLANQQPRLGQAFQVAFGFQHRCGRGARVECLAVVPALLSLNVGLHDRDPGLRGGQASRSGGREALGQGSLCPFQVAERKTHRPEQPEQVGVQPRAGRARREGTLQPAAGLLQQPARQPETAQRPGQLRPGLAAARQRVIQGGAEVVLLGQQNSQLAFESPPGARTPRRAVAGPARFRPPRSGASAAYWRMVSSNRYRVPPRAGR